MWIAPVSFVDFFFPLVSFFVALHGPLSSLFQPLRVPSRTPFPTFGRPLSIPLQPLSGPSPFFVALRGNVFAFCPSWTSSSPFPTFGRSLSSLLQPLSGPSPFFVALRGYRGNVFAFCPSWTSSSPFPTLHARKPGANAWHNRVGYCGFTGTGGMNEQATHRDGFLCGLSLQASPTGSHSSVE